MALVLKDRVKEVTTTVGTGSIALGGAAAGYQPFSIIGNGNTCYYTISSSGTEWEVGIGTYTSSGNTLSRDTILSSSNSGSIVTLSSGQKDIYLVYPAEKGVWLDSSDNVVQSSFTTLSASGTATISNIALTTGTISTEPSNGVDIVNKSYVDTVATGLHVHTPVRVESPDTAGNLTATYVNGGTTPTWTTITTNNTLTTGSAHSLSLNDVIVFGSTTNGITAGTPYYVESIPSSTSITLSLTFDGAQITTLTNGTGLTITSRANSGVGATLTNAGTQAALVIDGVSVSVGNRVLIYNQTNAYENGVYTVTTVGNGTTNWVLTRATDANTYSPMGGANSLGDGDYWYVTEGATGKGESYVFNTSGTIVFGTTSLSFVQFSSAQVYSAGTGLTLDSTTFSITPVGTASTYGSASQVPVFTTNASGQVSSVTNTSISINGNQITSGNVGVAYGGTGLTSYTSGDMLYASGTTTLSKLGIGSNNYVLKSDGSAPSWVAQSTLSVGSATTATTATNIASGALGSIPYQSSSGNTTLLAGNTTTTKNFLVQTGDGTLSAAPSWGTIQVADVPTLNQNTTGSAATLTTPRAIYGNNFDGSAALTQVIASTYGGTGNGFTKFSGPSTAEKTFTLPDANATILYDGGALGTPSSGTLTNCTFPTLNQNTTGSAGSVANALTAGTGVTYSSGTTYNGSAAITISIGQAVSTTSNVQFGSIGVNTAASGTAGEIRATNNVTAYYSDERLKTKLGNIDNALDKVKTLNGFYYEANEVAQALGYEVKKEVGISAQEVEAIMPEVVAPAPIDDKYLTVRYERLVPLLIEAIKELSAEVDRLKNKG